VVACFL
jgi:hypothetical protein